MNFRNLPARDDRTARSRKRRKTLRNVSRRRLAMEPLEDRRLLVIGAFNPAPETGRGTGFDGVVGLDLDGNSTPTSIDSECSGTLLNSGRHILTASHCEVTTGDSVIFDSLDSAPGNVILMQPTTVTDHPSWNGDTEYDNTRVVVLQQ